jgi:BirA family transcriptional regulator, biotin operon repressor / biotin---[acetyl-CoA-carboxylase] ligase
MNKDDILLLLRASRSGFVSGADLAASMGVSRTAVWKHVKALEREGYRIEAIPSKGYRLTTTPDVIVVGDVKRGLRTRTVGREIVHHAVIGSTNTLAMELAQKGAMEGTVVITEIQTGGKGRLGRTWVSPRGNLYLSVILRPAVPIHKAPLITLMGAVALAAAVRETLKVPAGIKWPNDVLISGKKVGGLLTEMSAEPDRIRHIVLGIGVNVNMDARELPPDVRRAATTLAAETGAPVDRTSFVQELLAGLDSWYQRFLKDDAEVLKAWEGLNITLGKRVTVSGTGTRLEGLACGVDAEGRLIVELDDGRRQQVAAGDVTIVKTEGPGSGSKGPG